MVDKVEDVLRLMQIASDPTRSIDERLDATLEVCRMSDHDDTKDDPTQQEENDKFIAALMQDARGHEIIVRTVLHLMRDAAA